MEQIKTLEKKLEKLKAAVRKCDAKDEVDKACKQIIYNEIGRASSKLRQLKLSRRLRDLIGYIP